ncbi:HisA/HisF-related TIM barrel protein [Prosthecodimorpha staleyi]|uniref:HisA/HisF-related TIM barrel protein n=1 Tax=Prosthecodimorpha staleyi TaxID=2840188 RepID=UPI0021C47030|nr:HisA/HisF-related TIM barrel protein [Prosthecodimorpha staleyi]
MDVVPVLDLKQGLVVRARHGDRDAYRPIETPLAPSAAPLDVARGLLALHPFRRFYLADLDGIEGRGRSDAIVDALAAALPQVEFWVDNGLADAAACRDWLDGRRARLVIGSESQTGIDTARALGAGAVLSLDYRGDAFLGPASLETDAALWPDDVIVMTLARVGSGAGPDLSKLAAARGRSSGARLWAAGGVRGVDDLAALRGLAVSGALVATALHDGRLTAADLATLA